jgi:hypothetical protein
MVRPMNGQTDGRTHFQWWSRGSGENKSSIAITFRSIGHTRREKSGARNSEGTSSWLLTLSQLFVLEMTVRRCHNYMRSVRSYSAVRENRPRIRTLLVSGLPYEAIKRKKKFWNRFAPLADTSIWLPGGLLYYVLETSFGTKIVIIIITVNKYKLLSLSLSSP